MPAKKKTATKKATKKTTQEKTAAKKTAQKKTVKKTTATKPAGKKAAPKKAAAKKVAAKKPGGKKTTPKTSVQKRSSTKKKSVAPKAAAEKPGSSALKKAIVSREGAAASKKPTPIVFSLDDVEALVAEKKSKASSEKKTAEAPAPKPKAQASKKVVVDDQPAEKRVLGAASLADILGFNPAEKKAHTELSEDEVPQKWKKYYKLLIKLRAHVSDEIDLHTADTRPHGSQNDSCDYADPADASMDTFDRDFAMSLVSSEQDALNQIEQAILRIKDGTYGVCENTGKAIPAARLTAVPFARYSIEGQTAHEKSQHRKRDSIAPGGIFGDVSDAPKLQSSDDEDE